MRVSVLNWQTTEAHVQLAIASVAEALGVSRHANVAPDHVADEKIST
jgi:hypothetical protein